MNDIGGTKGAVITGVIIGFFFAIVLALVAASKIESTSTVKFCSSCHEMKIFENTWAEAAHGVNQMGVMKAKCVDCHLPHEGVVDYLITKSKAGIHDYIAHIRGKKTDWISKWKNRGPHVHGAYESGCKKCHKKLIAPGIPIKAFTAHRAYELGETKLNCIDCHHMAGHGDLVLAIMESKNK